jgi:hypothetical protein
VNDRARLPFALVGVLVLVSSATLAATVGTNDPASTPTVDRAMDGATAETVTALRTAADEAATETAANPVTVPANTTAGRALDGNRPFRDALRLRMYLLARQRLDGVEVRRGGVVATASLPPVEETTEGYRTAIERVRVERAGANGTALRVEIEGVGLSAVHEDRQVASEELSPSFVVANPALFAHDRTETFERRANAPVTEPGVGRRLTTRLYPVAWARGYAQYGGAPIANVVGTRHVELTTNDALLSEQRAVFGASDPAGERGVAAAARRVAVEDLLAATNVSNRWTDVVLAVHEEVDSGPTGSRAAEIRRDPPEDPTVTVGVNGSADRAYARTVGIEGGDELARAIERAHTVQARIETDASSRLVDRRTEGSVGAGWDPVEKRGYSRVSLERTEGPLPGADGWTTRDGAVYRAHETAVTTRTWERDGERRTTRTVVERTYRVHVAVQARTAPVAGAPEGRLDGPLSDATERAVERAISEAGGLESAARDAVDGDAPEETVEATAAPTVERDAVESDVRNLRERTRNVDTTVPATDAATGGANPPRRLRANLTARHDRLRGQADRTAAERARVAAREAYLTALEAHLRGRVDRHARTNEGIEDRITDHIDPGRLDGALAAHRAALRPSRETYDDPAGELSLAVETGPSYLPTSRVERDRVDARGDGAVRPLATRNVNVFASPHGHVAEAVFDRIPLIGDDTVALSTAAEVLAGMDGTEDGYEALRREVRAANRHVRGELLAAMTAEGVPEQEARGLVETDATPAAAARALTNGSTVERAAGAADGEADRDALRVRLEVARESALTDDAARPSLSATNEAEETVKKRYRKELQLMAEERLASASESARKRALGKKMGSLPAGMPLAPVPGYWYATANVWYVDVGGTYERFVVRANRTDATAPTAYVREGRATRLEHGDESVRLGRDEKVSFRTETAVVVVVPSGPNGVGDTDGIPDERSPGWPPDERTPNGS